MKQLLIVFALFASISLSAQDLKSSSTNASLPVKAPVADTLSVPAGTTVVKIGKQAYNLEAAYPGVFSLNFNADALNTIMGIIDRSAAPHTDVEAAKKFFMDQLKAKGLIKEPIK
jgi:hypothetical protein